MSKKKSNQKKYLISWSDGEYSNMMNSLEECERHITIENSFADIQDVLVYEVSATYTVKNTGFELRKRSAGVI